MTYTELLARAYQAGASQYTCINVKDDTFTRSFTENPEPLPWQAEGLLPDEWQFNDEEEPLSGAYRMGPDGNPSGDQMIFE